MSTVYLFHVAGPSPYWRDRLRYASQRHSNSLRLDQISAASPAFALRLRRGYNSRVDAGRPGRVIWRAVQRLHVLDAQIRDGVDVGVAPWLRARLEESATKRCQEILSLELGHRKVESANRSYTTNLLRRMQDLEGGENNCARPSCCIKFITITFARVSRHATWVQPCCAARIHTNADRVDRHHFQEGSAEHGLENRYEPLACR